MILTQITDFDSSLERFKLIVSPIDLLKFVQENDSYSIKAFNKNHKENGISHFMLEREYFVDSLKETIRKGRVDSFDITIWNRWPHSIVINLK